MRALVFFIVLVISSGVYAQSFGELQAATTEAGYKKLISAALQDGMRDKAYFGLIKLGFHYSDHAQIIKCDSVLTVIDKEYKEFVLSQAKWRTMDDSDYYYLLSSYYYLKNDIRRFRTVLSKATALNPRDLFASDYLFRMFVNEGNLDSAELFVHNKFRNLSRTFDVGQKELVQFEMVFRNICELKALQHDVDGLHYYLTKWLSIKSKRSGNPDLLTDERFAELTIPQLLALSKYYTFKGNFHKALKVLNRASLTSRTDDFGLELKRLRSYSEVYYANNDVDSSVVYLGRILRIHEENVRKLFPTFTESERENYVNGLNDDFDIFLSIVSGNVRMSEKYITDLYDFQLFRKGLLLNTSKAMAKITSHLENSDAVALLKKIAVLKDSISLVTLHSTTNNKKTEYDRQVYLNNLNEEKETYERQIIRIAMQDVGDLVENIKNTQVRDALPAGTGLLEMIRFTKWGKGADHTFEKKGVAYMGLILSKEYSTKMVLVNDGDALERRNIKLYNNYIRTKLSDTLSYSVLWEPFVDQMPNIETIYVSADGIYNLINLNTLRNDRTKKYVLDERKIINITSGKDIVNNGQQAQITNEALLLGFPSYNSDAVVPATIGTTRGDFLEEFENLSTVQFSPLPATKDEIEQISSIIEKNDGKATVLMGPAATESNLRAAKIPSILHMATHGFFISDNDNLVNPLLKSGLILAGANNAKKLNDDDGILTAFEITSLDLKDTELVVLSACETGLGEVRNGDGVYGLQRAFKVAESRFIITSLWKVDDEATMKLMTLFYQALESSHDVIQSFEAAQKQLRDIYPSPYYWGAFKLVGN